MTNVSEFGALNWVKEELDVSVRKARRALEAYVESEGGNAELDLCADHLHQIAGVLQVVQIYGPGMLAEEMEVVARAMADGLVRQMQEAAEALMLALIQLPDYLEKLQAGNADVPLIILPLLNELRAVREAPLLSEAALFRPEIKAVPVAAQLSGEPNQHLPSLIRRLRQKFHVGLLGWFRQQQIKKSWQILLEVFDELLENAGTQQFYRLVWVSGALIQGLIDHSITSGVAVKQLFSKVDRQLKHIIDDGESALEDEQADELLKNLLYYIAQAETENPRIREIKEAFNLEHLLPSEAELTQGRQGLSGSNAELAASISDAVQKELTRIKDVLDLFMRQQDAELGMLEHLEKPMRQLADTLGMIGQGALRSRLLRQANKVQGFLEKETPPEEYELMEMAGDILFVESSLSTFHTIESTESVDFSEDGQWGLGLPESEYQNLLKQTVREAKVDIAKAKEAIIGYTETPSEPDLLVKVHAGLSRVYGALKILELNDAAQILYKTAEFIKSDMIDDKLVVDRQQLNSLADVISSIEYFLEALVDGAGNRREIIAIAQSALSGLLQSKQDISNRSAVTQAKSFMDSGSEDNKQIETSQRVPEVRGKDQGKTTKEVEKDTEDLSEIPVPASEKPPLEDIDAEILEIFVEEAREELEAIQQDLPAWIKNNNNKDALISFRRSFHTLKGSGRLVGAKVIGEVAWSIENMLNKLIDETIRPTSEMTELLEHVLEILPELIDCQEKNVVPSMDVDAVMQRAFAIADGRVLDETDIDVFEAHKQVLSENKLESFQTDESSDADSASTYQFPSGSIESTAKVVDHDQMDSHSDSDGLLIESDHMNKEEVNRQQVFTDSDLMIELDTELLDVFAEETESHLADLEAFIRLAKSSNPRPQISDEIIRAFHTLHGSARMTGITPIANLSKAVEEYLKILAAKNKLAEDEVLTQLEGSMRSVKKYLAFMPEDAESYSDADSYLVKIVAAKDELLHGDRNEHKILTGEILDSDLKGEAAAESGSVSEKSNKALPDAASVDIDYPSVLQDEKVCTVDEDPELVEIFLEEAKELLEGVTFNFEKCLTEQLNDEQLEIIQRGLHTLKGSARLAGIMPVGDLAYAVEKLFNAPLDMSAQVSEPLVNIIRKSFDVLAAQVNEIEVYGAVHWADTHIDTINACIEGLRTSTAVKAGAENARCPANIGDGLPLILDTDENITSDTTSQEPNVSEFYEEPLSISGDDDNFVVGEDSEILEVFVDEAKGLLNDLEQDIRSLSQESDNTKQISEIQKGLHTLKGSARLAGVLPVGDISQALETLFESYAGGKDGISVPVLQVLMQSIDILMIQVHEAENLGRVHRAKALLEKIESCSNSSEDTPVSESSPTSYDDNELSASISDIHKSSEEPSSDILFEPPSYLQDDAYIEVGEDPELIEVFCEEAKEILEQLETGYFKLVSQQK